MTTTSKSWAIEAHSEPDSPQRPPFRIETAEFECALDTGVAGMNFCGEPADSPLPGDFQKRGQQASADALASPLGIDEHRDDFHRFAAELRAPYVRGVHITRKLA